jgi:hypothetical protein
MATTGKKAGEEALRARSRDWKAWRDSAVTLWAAADTLWQASGRRERQPPYEASSIEEALSGISPTTATLGLQGPSNQTATGNLGVVEPFANLRIPSFMLYGMALENFLKALLVKSNLPVPRSHKLAMLADTVRKGPGQLPIMEPSILQRFSNAITWFGRYPGPLEQHLPEAVDPSGGVAVAPRFTSSGDDRIQVVELLEKLQKLVGMK